MSFRRLTETELHALAPEELLAYHGDARRHGTHQAARQAIAILTWRFEDRVRWWARKVPPEQRDDVVGDVFESALRSSLQLTGTELGQFGAWLRQITRYRVADFFEARKRREQREGPLPEEHEAEEEIWGIAGRAPDLTEALVSRSVVEQALGELSDVHRKVIELAGPADMGFDQRPAKEVAETIRNQLSGSGADPMTDVNVHKIVSRFRRRAAQIWDSDAEERGDG